jgi:hypothetical protein
MIEIWIYLASLFISLGVVAKAGEAGYLNGAFQRAFAGGATQITSVNFLVSYTNTESFLRACYNGVIGISGYIFLLSLGFLTIIWVNNLIQYRQAII